VAKAAHGRFAKVVPVSLFAHPAGISQVSFSGGYTDFKAQGGIVHEVVAVLGLRRVVDHTPKIKVSDSCQNVKE